MRVIDLIHKKRLGHSLSQEEIRSLIDQYVRGDVPDYQMSALCMAILFQGMSAQETTHLTMAMAESGHLMNLSEIPGIKVDKHSTGGVADTTTLVLAPLVASVGVPIAKMSGRGLGHTGGTLDKLESIPGFSVQMSMEKFQEQVRTIGIAVAAQTADLAPADKSLYALRDVTDTVESIPLIASSIMSKKLASGADAIVLDVKVGEGAFMKDLDRARALAQTMVNIGRLSKRNTVAVLTQMDEPLGRAIGNALEVREAILTLRGQGSEDLAELCLILGSEMVVQGGKAKDAASARAMLEEAIQSGAALEKFKEFVKAQGGDERVADDLTLLPQAPVVQYYEAQQNGVITKLHAEALGLVAMRLGAGRSTRDDVIDPSVGLILLRNVGQSVVEGEPIVEIHARSVEAARQALLELADCIEISNTAPFKKDLLLDLIRDVSDVKSPSLHSTAVVAPVTEEGASNGLLDMAIAARNSSYTPYSKFPVGAALRLDNGEIIIGANVENASFGLTNCAERTAIFKAVTDHGVGRGRKIVEIAVAADSDGPVAPCGACRQVLAEFCEPDTLVVLGDLKGNQKVTSVSGLLPYSFDASQMNP